MVLASIGGVTMLASRAGWPERTRRPAGGTRRSWQNEAEDRGGRKRPGGTSPPGLAEERVKIARKLHDIVAHAMSVIAVRAGVARMVIDTQPEQAREALGIIETTTRQTLREMRLLVRVLRDPDGEEPS